jgi:hypothetical protein
MSGLPQVRVKGGESTQDTDDNMKARATTDAGAITAERRLGFRCCFSQGDSAR